MKKLAIIGASYLQNPLILKAKSMGIETHVFAWAANDIGEKTADYFYPISIVEKEQILAQCRQIGIDGIATIGSDLATIPVSYVANELGLVGNSPECVKKSTDKSLMRQAFAENGDPSPRSITVHSTEEARNIDFDYPLIVKPPDRSGSRGVTKVVGSEFLDNAIRAAMEVSFTKAAIVEEFAEGDEYSVEFISWKGRHQFLALTEKFTTGAPHFIEAGHLEPARVSDNALESIQEIITHALTSLGIEYGVSHSEVKVDSDGKVKIIEIGARMGGDFIGSDLVQLSTGYDLVKAVIDVALGIAPERIALDSNKTTHAGVRFVFDQEDVADIERMMADHSDLVIRADYANPTEAEVTDSSTRFGYCLFASDALEDLVDYLPRKTETD